MKSPDYPQKNPGRCAGAYRKIIVGVAIAIAAVAAVYLVYFRHGSPDDIMAANMARRAHARTGGGRQIAYDDYEDYDYEDDVDEKMTPKSSKKKWDKWIFRNNHVSIGELYNKCDGDDRLMVGRVIMQADKVHGGVKSTTYLNHTIDFELTSGEMYIEVQYNGKDLYSNHWELCTVEEGMEDRIIFCPIPVGKKNFVKDLPIPSYLPKGRYATKAWMTDQDENVLGCAFSEFSL